MSNFGQSQFNTPPQFDQVQKSLSQVHLSNSQTHGGSGGDNFPIAEEDKEQETNEMSDEKIKKWSIDSSAHEIFVHQT